MKDGAFEAPLDGLGARAASSVVKTGLSQGVRLVVQIASVVVLSRLLPPSEFGLFAMATPIVAFALLFQDLGFAQAIIQKPGITQAEASVLFAVSLCVSAALALVLVLAAPLAAAFYTEPRIDALMKAMGLSIVLGGAGSIHGALLNRRMQFGALAIIDSVSAISGLAASVVFAILTESFWALYVGSLVSTLVPTLGFWIVSGWRPSWPRRGAGAGALMAFGANITGFNVANFFARNLDKVLIGKVWGDQPLGLYDRAYKLLLLPIQQINAPVSRIMLPVLSKITDDAPRYRSAYLRAVSQTLNYSLPLVAFLVGISDILIPMALGQQWSEAAPIFAALGMAGFLQILNNTTGWLFMSQGRTAEYFRWGLFGSATSLASFAIGLPYGPFGVAVAYAASEYVRTPILWWYVTRRGPLRARDVLAMASPHFCGALAALLAVLAVRMVLPPWPLVILAVSLVLAYLVSVTTLAAFARGRETIRDSVGLIRRLATRAFLST